MSNNNTRYIRYKNYVDAWNVWFQALPTEEQERLRRLKIDQPSREQFGEVNNAGDDFDPDIVQVEASAEDESELARSFGEALVWCVGDGRDLVAIGKRFVAVMHVWRPSLVAGMALEMQYRGGCKPSNGQALGAVLEWGRRGGTISQIGQRVMAMAYVINPSAISGATLQQIGALSNKTRQAVDKLVQDFRDTFGGIKSRSMRSEKNRKICKIAQLQKQDGLLP